MPVSTPLASSLPQVSPVSCPAPGAVNLYHTSALALEVPHVVAPSLVAVVTSPKISSPSKTLVALAQALFCRVHISAARSAHKLSHSTSQQNGSAAHTAAQQLKLSQPTDE